MKSRLLTFCALIGAAAFVTELIAADKPASNATGAAPPPPLPGLASVTASNAVPDRVIVKAKGFEIKQSQFDKSMADLKKEAAAGGQDIPAAELENVQPKLLNHLILTQLLDTRATEADRAKGKAEAETRVGQLKEQMHGEDMLVTMLKSAGMTLEELRKQFTTEATSHAVLLRMVNVTDEQIKQYYETNAAKFEEPEKVRASHILIGTMNPKTGEALADAEKKAKKALADSLLKRARDGEDFAKLAKEFSEDPGSKDNGGEYTFGRHEMVPEFEATAFALTNNQVSDIVTTQFGYHIIKLNEKIPGHKVDLAKATPEIRDALQDAQIDQELPKLFAQWRKDSQVEIVDEKLKALDAKEAEELKKGPPPAVPAPVPPPIPPK